MVFNEIYMNDPEHGDRLAEVLPKGSVRYMIHQNDDSDNWRYARYTLHEDGQWLTSYETPTYRVVWVGRESRCFKQGVTIDVCETETQLHWLIKSYEGEFPIESLAVVMREHGNKQFPLSDWLIDLGSNQGPGH